MGVTGNIMKKMGDMTKMEMAGHAMNIGFGVHDYTSRRNEGQSNLSSAAGAIGTTILSDVMGFWPFIGLQLAPEVPKLLVGGYEKMGSMAREMTQQGKNTPFQNNKFADSQQAYTMRQSGLSLARAAKSNLKQTTLGNEAQYLHY